MDSETWFDIPDKRNDSQFLHTAVKMGYLKTVEVLLKYGADVNIKDQRGYTLLHSAVESAELEMTQLLINYGADVNAKNNAKKTPIFLACRGIHFISLYKGYDLVNALPEHGVDVDSRHSRDMLPHFVAEWLDCLIIETLLNSGADINSIDKHGLTPLHYASISKQPEIVELLLRNGADINVIGKEGYTALDFADVDIVIILWRISRCTLRRIEITESLVRHIAKMKAKHLFVSEKYLQSIDKRCRLKEYYNGCKTEIEKMKNVKISNTKVSFYDMLMKDVHQLAKYSRNENIVETMESSDYLTMFPIYADIIQNQFEEAQERESLLNSCIESLKSLSGYELPYIFANKIFGYLSNFDLEHLIEARPDASGDEK